MRVWQSWGNPFTAQPLISLDADLPSIPTPIHELHFGSNMKSVPLPFLLNHAVSIPISAAIFPFPSRRLALVLLNTH